VKKKTSYNTAHYKYYLKIFFLLFLKIKSIHIKDKKKIDESEKNFKCKCITKKNNHHLK